MRNHSGTVMAFILAVAVGVSPTMAALASGVMKQPSAHTTPYVSSTFQDILKRVSSREKQTGAIMEIKPREDGPPLGYGLRLRMKKHDHEDIADVTLFRNLKTGDDIFEHYQLRIDKAMRLELLKLQRFEDAQAAAEKQRYAALAKEIQRLSKGTLKQGMTVEEVQELKGEPLATPPGFQPPPPPQAAAFAPHPDIVHYPDMTLYFHFGKLHRAEAVKPR